MRPLHDMLSEDLGLDLSGWRLLGASGISDDGRVIFGSGWHNGRIEGWVAIIPEPAGPALFVAAWVLALARPAGGGRFFACSAR